ncbi:hypothetical protein [Bradyrhizobium barranii]
MRTASKLLCFAAVFSLATGIIVEQSGARPRSNRQASDVWARVIIYDVIPGQEGTLERELITGISDADIRRYGIINDRSLRNIDPIALQYASYTKFSSAAGADRFLAARTDRVKDLVRRTPESHLVQLESTYWPRGVQSKPKGIEFGYKEVGQTAHLFLGLPDPNYGQEYFDALVEVKRLSVRRVPQGWLGDDLLSDNSAKQPDKLAPYSPRPASATTLSVNYAEYKSFENAEDAYLNRQNSDDPSLIELQRVFFGALQVPARFYIFKVIANR